MTKEYKLELIRIIRNKLSTTISDSDIDIGIDEVEQYILNYCCISDVPHALRFVMANMVVDLLNYQFYKKNPEGSNGDGTENNGVIGIADISNIQVGDTQIKLGSWSVTDSRTQALKSHVANLDEVLFNYNAQLNQFRRLYWW